jgi:hypothetical protein
VKYPFSFHKLLTMKKYLPFLLFFFHASIFTQSLHAQMRDTLTICAGQKAHLFGAIVGFSPDCTPLASSCAQSPFVPPPPVFYWEANGIQIEVKQNFPSTTVSPTTTTLYTQAVRYSCPRSSNCATGALGGVKKFKETLVIVVNCNNSTPIKDTIKLCLGQSANLTGITRFSPDCQSNTGGINSGNGGIPTDNEPTFYWETSNSEQIPNSGQTATVSPATSTLYKNIVRYNCLGGPASNGSRGPLSPDLYQTLKETFVSVGNCTVSSQPCSEEGTFFFEQCANEGRFFFVKLKDGRIFDPYFTNGLNWEVKEGQKVKFSFIDTSFVTPCPQAEKAITITCVEEILPVFYTKVIDTIRICAGQSVNLKGLLWNQYSTQLNCPTPAQGPSPSSFPPSGRISTPVKSLWQGLNLDNTSDSITAAAKPITTTLYQQNISYTCQYTTARHEPSISPREIVKTVKETLVIVENCQQSCSTEGTFFFQQCANQGEFFFIKLKDGRVFDPYFVNGLNWEVKEGQKVKFNYVDTSFFTPCPQAEKAITITCVEEIQPTPETLFEDYPWLKTKVDAANCDGTKISEYNFGGYTFIFVESPTKSVIYYNGAEHCTSSSSFDCRPYYGIANKHASRTYTCAKITNGIADQALKVLKNPVVSEEKGLTKVLLAPNPVDDNLTVEIKDAKAAGQLTIYDIYGHTISTRKIEKAATENKTLNLDFSNFQSGLYLLEWRSKGFSIVKKVVKQ